MTLDINLSNLPDFTNEGPSEATLNQIYVDEVAAARKQFRLHATIAAVGLGLPLIAFLATRLRGEAALPLEFLYPVGLGVAGTQASVAAWRNLTETIASTPENLQVRREQREAAAEARRERLSRARAERPPLLTIALVVIVVLVGMVQAWRGVGSLAAVSLAPDMVANHQWWRVGTAWFAHASGSHLLGSLLILVMVGLPLELISPRWRLPLVFLVAGVAGSLASIAFHAAPRALGPGASLAGVWAYQSLQLIRQPTSLFGSPMTVAYELFWPLSVVLVSAQLAGDPLYHFAGALAGALIAWITVPRGDGSELESAPLLDGLGKMSLAAIAAIAIFAGAKMWTAPVVVQPIALVRATVLDSTGRAHNDMTVVIESGAMTMVEPNLTDVPGARVIGTGSNLVVAVTLDKSEPVILKSLRHAWVGQVFIGAPSDVFIIDTTMRRGRGQVTDVRTQDINERNLVAAVVDGKYYSRAQLLAQLK